MKLDVLNLDRLNLRLKVVGRSVESYIDSTIKRTVRNVELQSVLDIGIVANLNPLKIKERMYVSDGRDGTKIVTYTRDVIGLDDYSVVKLPVTPPRNLDFGGDPLPGIKFKIWRMGNWSAPRGSFAASYRGKKYWKRTRVGGGYSGRINPRIPIKVLAGPALSTIVRKHIYLLDGLDKYTQKRVLFHANGFVDIMLKRLGGVS